MTHFEAIPPFLLLTAEERAAAWKGRRLTQVKNEAKADYAMPRSADATARALAKEREVTRQAKAKARLAKLRKRS